MPGDLFRKHYGPHVDFAAFRTTFLQRYKKMADTMVMDVSQDWATACDVQQRFMDHTFPTTDGISYAARCQQLRALGGDCYDFLPLADDRLAFAIGDASGKSLPAALMIANVQSSLRTATFFVGNEPAALLGAVNRQLHTASLDDRFATLFYGVFDADTRMLHYANAGHNPPFVIRRDGSVDWLDIGGLPLGLFTDSAYEEGAVHLDPGDVVVAYTDGVVEAVNASGEEWGVEGIRKAAERSKTNNADDLVDTIFASLNEFTRGRRSDDASVVVLLAN
jgi:phosphoserine phosphatase RsbU/P